jgi:general secretion pathway protein A
VYHQHFDLSGAPFSTTPDPRVFYVNEVYREAYATLVYGVRERKGFVLLTGEVGTGKTTLLRRAIRELESSAECVFVYNTRLDFDELLAHVVKELHITASGPGRAAQLDALNERLLSAVAEERTVAVFIDEAQHLTADTLEGLRLLSNLETAEHKLLQIVLVGQPELDAKLRQPDLRQLRQRITMQARLEPLAPDEVADFIDYRLKAFGGRGRRLFTRKALALIATASRGLPRLVNAICDNAMLAAFGSGARAVSRSIVADAIRDLRLTNPDGADLFVPSRGELAAMERFEWDDRAEDLLRRWRGATGSRVAMTVAVGAVVLLVGTGAIVGHTSDRPASGPFGMIRGAAERLFGDPARPVAPAPGWPADEASAQAIPAAVAAAPSASSTPGSPHALPLTDTRERRADAPERRADAPERRDDAAGRDEAPARDLDVAVGTRQLPDADVRTPRSRAAERRADTAERRADTPERRADARGRVELPPRLVERTADAAVVARRGVESRVESAAVPPGPSESSTLSALVQRHYADRRLLAMDVVQELNEGLGNVNIVRAGQRLWLPPLTTDTLLRAGRDGRYTLIVGSFSSESAAREAARTLARQGYQAQVTRRALTDRTIVYRVSIPNLEDRRAADRLLSLVRSE